MSPRPAAAVTYCQNPFHPSLDRRTVAVRRRRRVRALAPKWQTPYIALYNGRALLRHEWRRKVGAGDTLTFVALPMGGGGGGGGGGKNPLAMVAQIALMVVAPQVGLLAGPVGSFANLAARAAFSVVGGMLVNAAFGSEPPSPPTPQVQAALAAPSPTYNINAQGNSARLEQPIPAWYGYHNIYPDFAADPYVEYVGNEQYLYQLLLVTQGWFDIDEIRIEDTPVASFADITTEVVNPGEAVTLFPTAVTTSVEVAGAELVYDTPLGPYVANSAGTDADAIGIDLVCPRGLYYANSSGGLDTKSVTVLIQAREIDDSGTPVGAGTWATLGTETISGATTTPQRRSYRYAVTAGRYEVKATRTTTKDSDSRAGHDVLWGGLRAYLPGTQEYGDVTLIAMRMKASNSLSQAASRRVNVLGTRMLPIWDAGTGWSAPTATRSIAWAAADICRAAYGADLPDSAIALTELAALDTIWTARGDEFNGGFDQRVTFWEALKKVCRAGRAHCYVQGGIVRFVRDQAASLPVAMFTPRNIVSGSWRTEYLLPSGDRADSVTATFVNEATWKPTPVECVLPDSTSDRPAKISPFGVTNRAQAWREGIYEAAANKYRTRIHTFETEMEGFILSPLDLIAISRDRPNWGQSGEILGYTALTIGGIIALSEPVTFTAGNHYLAARDRDGSMAGPWQVTAGADSTHVVLAEAMTLTPDTGTDRERTHFAFGPGTAYVHRARVLPDGLRIKGPTRVEISCVNESDAVHDADGETVPDALTSWSLPTAPTAPTVSGLRLTITGLDSAPTWTLDWNPAPGAAKYLIEHSPDGINWCRTGDTEATSYSFNPAWPGGSARVAGMGKARGAWVSISTADRTRTINLSEIVDHDATNALPAVPTDNIVLEAATFTRTVYDTDTFSAGTTVNTWASLTFTVSQPCKVIINTRTHPYSYTVGTSYESRIEIVTTHTGGTDTAYTVDYGTDIPHLNGYRVVEVEAGEVTIDWKGYFSIGIVEAHRIWALVSLR